MISKTSFRWVIAICFTFFSTKERRFRVSVTLEKGKKTLNQVHLLYFF